MSYDTDTDIDTEKENIAGTLARVLPDAKVLHTEAAGNEHQARVHIVYPRTMEHKVVDAEALLPNPRRTKGIADFDDLNSFAYYVHQHRRPGTTVWCDLNPRTFDLTFTAVIDDHSPTAAGWRGHKATFSPAPSVEWGIWANTNKKTLSQLEFAEFIEANEQDIHSAEGLPSSLDMHKLATEFVARQDVAIKSAVRLQNGGVNLTYVNDADTGTTETMKVFERFAIAVPVFWTAPQFTAPTEEQPPVKAYRIDARLKYRLGSQKVTFHYELIRPDRVHQKAAGELIATMQAELATVPLVMGRMRKE